MKKTFLAVSALAAGLTLAAGPAQAQSRPAPPSGASSSGGSAVDRGGSSSSGSGSSGTSSSSGSSGASAVGGAGATSGGATSAPWPGYTGGAVRERAPQHREGAAYTGGARTTSGAAGERAVPRGGAASANSPRVPARNNETGTSEVPTWSRPRGDRPGNDTAIDRQQPRPPNGGNGGYYPPYGGYYPGYGYGPYYPYYTGYATYYPYYDFGAACGFSYGYGFGYGMPLCYDPFYAGYGGMGYGGGYYGGYASSGQASYGTGDQGALRLKVKPREAQVYVDGFLAGTVDTMDGAFQKLPLTPGRHHVEVKADGYQPEAFDVMIPPNETITFQGTLKKQ